MTLTVANNADTTSVPILTPPARILPVVPKDYPFNGLTPDQKTKMVEFRSTHLSSVFAGLTGTPCANEKEFADDVCLLKFLKATKWDLLASAKRLQETMQWRRDFRPTECDTDDPAIQAVNAVGSTYFNGFDKFCRPILVLVSRLGSDVKDYDASLRLSLYTLEKGTKLMPPGVTQLNVVCDYSGMTMFNGYPLSVTSKFLGILAKHYPEMLGTLVNRPVLHFAIPDNFFPLQILINPSWYMPIAFTVLGPFIDPVTKSKMRFANPGGAVITKPENGTGGWCNILDIVDADQLSVEFGGSLPFVFDADTYWKAFVAVPM
ncbi:hypothetical protein HDU84_007031 [Entophlyctis sp. JEL0112]|nr:hypothetical protein HDU84_007031 [Entophlyctis sp. JEL0112]